MKVTAVTVNYNRPGDTVELITSIRHSDLADASLLVIDNGSTDGSPRILKATFPDLQIASLPQNLGFAGGFNYGMGMALEAGSDAVLIINNDTVVPEVFLGSLVTALASDLKIGAVSPKIYCSDGKTIWWAGGKLNLDRGQIVNVGSGRVDDGLYSSIVDCDYLTGCCVLFRSSALKSVGLFDPIFTHTGEDVDLSLRLTKAGYKLHMIPQSTLIHKVSQTGGGELSPFHLYNLEKYRILLMRKWGFWHGLLSWLALTPLLTRRIASIIVKGRSLNSVLDVIRGWRDGVRLNYEKST